MQPTVDTAHVRTQLRTSDEEAFGPSTADVREGVDMLLWIASMREHSKKRSLRDRERRTTLEKGRDALEGMVKELAVYAARPNASRQYVTRRQLRLNEAIDSHNMLETFLGAADQQVNELIDEVELLWGAIARMIIWCRLFGIPDGVRDVSQCVPGSTRGNDVGGLEVAGGYSHERLQAALNIRLERYREQGPAQPAVYEFPGGRIAHFAQPADSHLDGDWFQRQVAVDAALDAAMIDELMAKHFATAL